MFATICVLLGQHELSRFRAKSQPARLNQRERNIQLLQNQCNLPLVIVHAIPLVFTIRKRSFHNEVMTSCYPTTTPQQRGPGRPREFDLDSALESAVCVFKQRGYHATSISDLAEGMGLSTGSIYKAFKDKRGIFLAAYDRMTQQRTAEMRSLLELPVNGREMLRQALMHYVEQSSSAQGRQGCLVVATAVELSSLDEEIAERVAHTFRQRQQALAEMVERGKSDGSIAARIDSADAARMLFCLQQGMHVLGKAGAERNDLASVMELTLQALG